MDAGNRQRLEQGFALRHRLEVGREQNLRRCGCESLVGRPEGSEPALFQIEPQYRLVHLHPADFQFLETGEQALVRWHHARQQIELRRKAGLDLARMQQSERPDQGHLDRVAEFLGLLDLLEQPLHAAVEARVRAPFRYQIMVVGVEPLGHFHGRMVGVAARQREVVGQRQGAGIESEPSGHAPQVRGRLQHRVVPGEIAYRDEVQARTALPLPVFAAQITADFQ